MPADLRGFSLAESEKVRLLESPAGEEGGAVSSAESALSWWLSGGPIFGRHGYHSNFILRTSFDKSHAWRPIIPYHPVGVQSYTGAASNVSAEDREIILPGVTVILSTQPNANMDQNENAIVAISYQQYQVMVILLIQSYRYYLICSYP